MSSDKQPISDIAITASSFNPSRNETIRLNYTLTSPDKVTIHVYDPDNGLTRTLADSVLQEVGTHQVVWNGLDDEGKQVPNEAYTFTIETASGAVYDPTTFSGGIVEDITDAQFSAGNLVYKLPEPSRVLIRLGIHSGPMYKTLIDWKPRIGGSITEYWDGRDENKVINLMGQKGFSALVTYVTLPKITVITYGNDKETYREYKLGRGKDRPKKPKRQRQPETKGRLRPASLVPPAWSRAPQVMMVFPDTSSGEADTIPKLKESIQATINVDPSDRTMLLDDQFEVMMFIDSQMVAEAERGYLPLNWTWDLRQYPPGEHILTVNISSFKGQVGVVSRKVIVEH